MTDAVWSVRPTDAQDRRVHFAGIEADARRFVENHFPRPHIADPNSEVVPDVALHAPDGSVHHFVNGEWVGGSVADDDHIPAADDDNEGE